MNRVNAVSDSLADMLADLTFGELPENLGQEVDIDPIVSVFFFWGGGDRLPTRLQLYHICIFDFWGKYSNELVFYPTCIHVP